MHFEFAVYLPPVPYEPNQPMQAVTESLKGYPDLKLVDKLPEHPQGMLVHAKLNENVQGSYVPPSPDMLKYSGHGLTSKQVEALQNASAALILDFAHPQKDVWKGLRAATELVSDIAAKTDGLIWDEETREAFSPESWRQLRMNRWTEPPRISHQIIIHAYNTGHSVRAITLGMAKMGLPDLIVEETGWSNNTQVENLITLVGQALAEGQLLTRSGEFRLALQQIKNADEHDSVVKSLKTNATKVGCLTLIPGKWEEGDPHNTLIRLTFAKYPGKDSQARQDRMVSSFFGWEEDIAYIKEDDELSAASARAKQQLPALQKAFAAGFQPGESLQLKAPFKTDSGGIEWMWVQVTSWRGNRIKGILNNEPDHVQDLHLGQKVEVRQEEIFDYLHTFPDDREEGNTTTAIIQRMQRVDDATKHPNLPPVIPACDAGGTR
jgi:uncharacterized protein YegJ (DUF2314 family)